MAKRKSTGAKLELIGGIYYVEEFSDGSEKRGEIDGESVLKLLLQVIADHAKHVISETRTRKTKK